MAKRSKAGRSALKIAVGSVATGLLSAVIMQCGVKHAEAGPPAPAVNVGQAGALNLGGTSFYDGFGRLDMGFTFMQYGLYSHVAGLTDINGNFTTPFKQVNFDNFMTLEQVHFTTPWRPFGGAVVLSAAVPLIDFNTTDDPSGRHFSNNRFGIGDMTWGPGFQSAPIYDGDRIVFVWRAQMQIISPAGEFNSAKNLNQSSGFWVINPYYAFTWLPAPKFEISGRIHYILNTSTDQFSDPNPAVYTTNSGHPYAKASDGWFTNFTSSYEFDSGKFIGVNGYYLHGFGDNEFNGVPLPNTRQEYLFFGPGGRWNIGKADFLNVNFYLPVIARDATPGPRLNFQYIHRFDSLDSIEKDR
ncbi:MAG: transporter [Rhodomicrobium sp.]